LLDVRIRGEDAFAGYTRVRIEELIDGLKTKIRHPNVVGVCISKRYIKAAPKWLATDKALLVV
jgi:hypothetical protein